MSVRKLLNQYRAERRKALVSFLMVGDPNLEATELYARTLVNSGTDILELGVPFSDPMADGPLIQRSSQRALKNQVRMKDVMGLVERLRISRITTPIVLFTYFNPLLAMGVSPFAQQSARSGVDAVLVVDLPPEEATEYRQILSREGVETVFLASPTTSEGRLRLIDDCSTGCVYYVSRTGTTGVQNGVSETLKSELQALKKICDQPVIVGFGVSTPDHARNVALLADGVVVGSAFIQLIEKNLIHLNLGIVQSISDLALFGTQLATAVRGASQKES